MDNTKRNRDHQILPSVQIIAIIIAPVCSISCDSFSLGFFHNIILIPTKIKRKLRNNKLKQSKNVFSDYSGAEGTKRGLCNFEVLLAPRNTYDSNAKDDSDKEIAQCQFPA